jgi:hypothetical protein
VGACCGWGTCAVQWLFHSDLHVESEKDVDSDAILGTVVVHGLVCNGASVSCDGHSIIIWHWNHRPASSGHALSSTEAARHAGHSPAEREAVQNIIGDSCSSLLCQSVNLADQGLRYQIQSERNALCTLCLSIYGTHRHIVLADTLSCVRFRLRDINSENNFVAGQLKHQHHLSLI